MKLPSLRRLQRGAFAVEAALALPILIGVGVIGADMQRIHSERIRVENAAGVLAVNIAAQRRLTTAGIDVLADVAMQGHEAMQQLYILNVLQSGRVAWALRRGGADALCDAPVAGGVYTGQLPEDPPAGNSNAAVDNSTMSLIVVKTCRDTGDIALSSGVMLPAVLETLTLFRATNKTITLDTPLTDESRASGLAFPQS
ncbi:hypothetical protein ANDA3_0775 [plant metagenome]|uniref:Pilus assembly protein n=1 Tax=plant metagenome TaxID=1297885 RepID=A0A484Q6I8_9ZZZZ